MNKTECRGYAGSVPVYCSHDKIVPIEEVKPNPKNPNQHPESQIEMLAKIITTQGWRAPVTVSTRSGLVVRGHGRLMAAKFAGLEFVPVDFQHYESNDAELADLLAADTTLYGHGYPVYYAFLVKCAHFVDLFQKPLMTPMLIREPKTK